MLCASIAYLHFFPVSEVDCIHSSAVGGGTTNFSSGEKGTDVGPVGRPTRDARIKVKSPVPSGSPRVCAGSRGDGEIVPTGSGGSGPVSGGLVSPATSSSLLPRATPRSTAAGLAGVAPHEVYDGGESGYPSDGGDSGGYPSDGGRKDGGGAGTTGRRRAKGALRRGAERGSAPRLGFWRALRTALVPLDLFGDLWHATAHVGALACPKLCSQVCPSCRPHAPHRPLGSRA